MATVRIPTPLRKYTQGQEEVIAAGRTIGALIDGLGSGQLTHDKILIDSTSGNTGVAYSMVGAALGIRVHLVMPENVSVARKQITMAYGTELIFSSGLEGSDGAIRMVREIVARD